MTTRGSGASYIVTSVSRVVAATFTVLTVYIDSNIFYPGLRGLLRVTKLPPHTCTVQEASVMDTEELGSWQGQGKVDASLQSAIFLVKLSYIFWRLGTETSDVNKALFSNYPSPYPEFHKSQLLWPTISSKSAMCSSHNLHKSHLTGVTLVFSNYHNQYEYITRQPSLFSFYIHLWKSALVNIKFLS